MRTFRFAFSVLSFCLFSSYAHSATLIHNQSISDGTLGGFASSTGAALSSGGVSIGYFSDPLSIPTDAQIKELSPQTAFSVLVNTYKYVDLRSLPGTTPGANFDWAYGGITGTNLYDLSGTMTFTTGAIGSGLSSTNLPQNTQLYLFGFNAGSFVGATPSSSFASATEWAAIKELGGTGTAPANTGGSRNIRVLNADGVNEVLVGTESGLNVNMVAAIPEPSRALLGMIGLMGLFIRRRR